jgi:uncharacterized protein
MNARARQIWVRHFALLLCLWLLAATQIVWAQQVLPLPPLSGPVIDQTGVLTAQESAALGQKIRSYNDTKGAQLQVVIVPTTQPEDIAQYGIRLMNAYKIGRVKIDDGAILIIALQDRRMRIETGYGLEGVLPDATCNRIIEEILRPNFRANNFYGGVDGAIDAMTARINGEELPPPPVRNTPSQGPDLGTFIMAVLFFSIFVGPILRAIFGKYLGPLATGVGGAGIGYVLMSAVPFAAAGGVIALVLASIFGSARGGGGWHTGGLGGGASGSW